MERTTDITPSWSDLLPVLLGVLQNPNAPVTAHKQAEGELTRMASLADKYIMVRFAEGHDVSADEPRLGDPDKEAH